MWKLGSEPTGWDKSKVGGKAYHLAKLTGLGLKVPEFGVLTSDAHLSYLRSKTFGRELIEAVHESLNSWGAQFFAVRSSMSKEDGEVSSFAGIFDTFLFVEAKDVMERVLDCYRSIESERAVMYLEKNGLKPSDLGVAVVIQKMVDAQCSGVAFSRAPVGHSGLVYIEAGLGLGEGVVSGQVEVDRYWSDRFGDYQRREIGIKKTAVLYDPVLREVKLTTTDESSQALPCLSPNQVVDLRKRVLEIESNMGCPVDVEWAIDKNSNLFLLQARAITQKFSELNFYMDTNLAESYPGLVSPMTASFIPRVYEKVIGEGIEILGVPRRKLDQLKPALKVLIYEVEGHLYYNLKNYYTVLARLPGGKSNVEAWHQMIGGEEISVPFQEVQYDGLWEKLQPNLNLVRIWLNHKSIFEQFLKASFADLDHYKSKIESAGSSREVARLPEVMLNEIKSWGLTIINDFLVIVGLKILNRIISENNLPADILVEWLKTEEGVDSMGALIQMKALKADLKNPKFWQVVNLAMGPDSDGQEFEWFAVFQLLESHSLFQEKTHLEEFLSAYGDRSFEELKLESMPFSEDPRAFFQMLSWISEGDKAIDPRSKPPSQHSESDVNWKGRLALKVFLPLTRRAVEARESTRLMRGRFYGLLRSSVLKLAKLVKTEHPEFFLEFKKEDFFYLTLRDLKEYGAEQIAAENLAERIRDRKVAWPKSGLEYPERYATSDAGSDSEPYFLAPSTEGVAGDEPMESRSDRMLKGLGAAPGDAIGRALVLSDPRSALEVGDLSECILVTRSTDPAWIFIMSKCRGLVSEKGSLLSHTAIVGRELGLPTVVGVQGACKRITDGQTIQINGSTGEIHLGDR